jgi:endonuclease G
MDETFFLSNMVPQVGLTFNRGIWASLEGLARDWIEARDECWIITGPLFYDPLEEDPDTADGLIPYFTIGDNDVAVPTHCFKIVLSQNDEGKWEAIAFVLENKRYSQPYRLHLYRTTIDWIEARTGLDFFPELTKDSAMLQAKKSEMWEHN